MEWDVTAPRAVRLPVRAAARVFRFVVSFALLETFPNRKAFAMPAPRSTLQSLTASSLLALGVWSGAPSTALAQVTADPAAPSMSDSPLFVAPVTAEEKFRAAVLMSKLARVELANGYLQQLLAMNPDADTLLKLRQQQGTAIFLQLTRVPGLEATATELLNRINAAVVTRADSQEFLKELIGNLRGSPTQRAAAVRELQYLGAKAVPALLNNLRGEPQLLQETLVQMRGQAVGPMVGALQSADPQIQALAAETLGAVGTSREQVFLLEPAFGTNRLPSVREAALRALARVQSREAALASRGSDQAAAVRVLDVANEHLSGEYEWPTAPGDTGEISVWSWNGTQLNQQVLTKRQASVHYAERLAREAANIPTGADRAVVQVLAARLESDALAVNYGILPEGPGTALDLAIAAGPQINLQVLDYALREHVMGAAAGSLQALARNGSTALIVGSSANQPVLAALEGYSQRVQFAAAVAILHWEPTEPFDGAGRVVEILARTIQADPAPGGVVMDPNVLRGADTAALFGQMGYRAEVAPTGREGFELAATRGNMELAILHPNVIRWELSQTLANLRADARTARMPVVVYGPAFIGEKYQDTFARYKNVSFVEEVQTPDELLQKLQPVLAQVTPQPLTQMQRARMAQVAAFWLRRIATRNVKQVFDLAPAETALIAAVNRADVAADALVALGGVDSRGIQPVMAELATSTSQDEAIRELAGNELALHIERHGVSLTAADRGRIREAYQAAQSPGLRSALGAVLGALQPDADAVRRQILGVPAAQEAVPPAPPVAS